ncbi:programmed cell death 6-interacting protein-like [Helianthus annuus]|uniref:programmed cell death 6-interacting protein-like n=1 Tax=Helianthus annuus TaxID=4232 RepID=UPI000B8FC2F7|nr:programmed cell death 6-interacting protein-like [Helianthus annuus]
MTSPDAPITTTDANPPPPKSSQTQLHPVYAVTNIQQKVRVLDGVKVSYTSWVRLFTLHARGYRVLAHIDGTPPPEKTDPTYDSWLEIDSIVLQWIYSTLSNDLLKQVLTDDSTAHQAWIRIQNQFHNNKGARIAALEHEFANMALKNHPSLEAYFQKLRELADQLNDLLDTPIDDKRLVLQMVRGLPAEFDTMGSLVNQSLPPWPEACEMLLNDQRRRAARELMDGSPVVAAAQTTPTPPPASAPAPPPRDQTRDGSRDSRGRPNTSRNRGRGRASGPRNPPHNTHPNPATYNRYSSYPTPPSPYPYWPTPPYWTPPPCPYPTTSAWNQPWAPFGPTVTAPTQQHPTQTQTPRIFRPMTC